jgi:hypothetical protein
MEMDPGSENEDIENIPFDPSYTHSRRSDSALAPSVNNSPLPPSTDRDSPGLDVASMDLVQAVSADLSDKATSASSESAPTTHALESSAADPFSGSLPSWC